MGKKESVLQGCIWGPLKFNIFINYIFYFITQSKIYSYADDNTVSYQHMEVNILNKNLEKDGLTLIDLFDSNQIKTHPKIFQAVAVGLKSFEQVKHFALVLIFPVRKM